MLLLDSGAHGPVPCKASSWAESKSLPTLVTKSTCTVRFDLTEAWAQSNDHPDKYNDETSKFDQTVSINGEVVSTLSTSKLDGSCTLLQNVPTDNPFRIRPGSGLGYCRRVPG